MIILWHIVIWSLRGLALLIVLGLSALLLLGAWTMHQHGSRMYSVQTGSMMPVLHVGDAVITRSQIITNLHAGDVIAYRNNQGITVSHRLLFINKQSQTVTTQGDHNPQPDDIVPASHIIGKVQLVLPKLGRVTDLLHTPVGLIGLLYLPATICIVWQLRQFQQHLKGSYRLKT